MRAARFHSRGDIRVDEVPEPVTGAPHPLTGEEPPVVMGEVTLLGSLTYCGDHAATIALLADGKIDGELFITARISLDDLGAGGFRELIDHQETHVEILVQP